MDKLVKTYISLIFLICCSTQATAKQISPSEIKKIIISDSIESYPGNCPCPYNTDRAGRRCGKRSAYSRAGGYSPMCYDSDISDEMVESYRKEHASEKSSK